ncbi:MAG: PEGA domain-containing protein [Deltaproteobacteria bacterium]|nr:PEGA domain-containing protein [Deltaproteobacteria bacterium]
MLPRLCPKLAVPALACTLGLLSPGVRAEPAPAGAASAPAAESAKLAEARRLFHEGNELRRAGDCQRALELYRQSQALVRSVPNTWNAAVCLDALGRTDEALETYEQVLTEFRTELSEPDRATIRRAVEQLRAKMGSLDVIGNVAGTLVIDGRSRGRLPLGGPVRLVPGKHLVQVMKEGYATFETSVEVGVSQSAEVVARLQPLLGGGRLRIDAPALKGAEIYIDGALLGTAPWEGSLEPGEHRLVVRRGELGSAPAAVRVIGGQIVRPKIELGPLGPEMRVAVDPPSAEILIDLVPVGRGRWRGRLPRGEHRIEAREEGYYGEVRAVAVGPTAKLDAELRLRVDAAHPRWGAGTRGRAWVEAFGGVALAPGLGSGAESSCAAQGCPGGSLGLGILAGLRGGWELPVRLSIELAGGGLSVGKRLDRRLPESFYESTTGRSVPTSYAIEDGLRLAGPFLGAGLGQRVPLGKVAQLQAHLLVGALFAFARDEIGGSASSGGRDVPVVVESAGESVQAVDLFLMPELRLGVRLGDFGLGAGLSLMLLALDGPALETGDVRVLGDGCSGAPTAIDCAPGEALVAGERAYAAMLLWVPSLSASYLF